MERSKIYLGISLILVLIPFNLTYSFSSLQNNWSFGIFYVSEGTINIYDSPSVDSKITGHFTYLEKVLIVVDNNNRGKFGWQKVLYPKAGYVEEKYLITPQKKLEKDKRYGYKEEGESAFWQCEIKYCIKDYSFVKKFPDYQSGNIGIIKKEEKVLTILSGHSSNKIWTKILYPFEGYVLSEDILVDAGDFVLCVGGLYGVFQTPFEKNFTDLKKPLGGFLEFTKTNWKLSFRAGYNYFQSNISTYILKTNLLYLQIRYNIFSLFNNHINPYAFAGGCYWFSNFQNTKYPTLTTYFPLEKDSGPGYVIGGGLMYNLYGFFLDVQYFFFSSRLAVFGKEPLPGEFTNQYKLYPGSNQINVMLGYRFVF